MAAAVPAAWRCGNSGCDRDPTHDATRPHLFGCCGTVREALSAHGMFTCGPVFVDRFGDVLVDRCSRQATTVKPRKAAREGVNQANIRPYLDVVVK